MLAMTSLDIESCLWCMQDFAKYAIIVRGGHLWLRIFLFFGGVK